MADELTAFPSKARVITDSEHHVQIWVKTYNQWMDYTPIKPFPIKMPIQQVIALALKIDPDLDFSIPSEKPPSFREGMNRHSSYSS